ncbi:DUF4340 domain-containing protein [Methylophaga thiooxydans]|uniref:DUF4340 domain-containing protein n=1 Tax=Methylophaga thiooxydans TaxID=392484 RepID=UPI00235349EA|nr:DUF4340 domain-containing protein [Methylophaga thiooxydans]
MKSSYLTNLVLLIVVLALLWLSQREQPVSDQTPTISSLSASDVSAIEIAQTNKPMIKLERQHDAWMLTAPFDAQANQTRINLLLSLLSAPVYGHFQPMDQASLDQFGLSKPETTLTFNDQHFYFGGVETLNKRRYVLHKEVIYLLDDNVAPLLRASAGSFVDNRLIAEQNTITQLTISDLGDNEISLSLQDGHWKSSGFQSNTDQLKSVIDSWQMAYAMQVRYLDKQTISTLPAPEVRMSLENRAEPLELIMTETAQSLQIVNPALQLQYDFPLALKKQLLPNTDTE